MPLTAISYPTSEELENYSFEELHNLCSHYQGLLKHCVRAQSSLQSGQRVLELLYSHADLQTILTFQCREAEQLNQGMIASVLRFDSNTNRLYHCASNSLPDDYVAAINGVEIGEGVGSCGTAAATGKRVIVEDIQTHPYWHAFKEIAGNAGLAACWSVPVFSSDTHELFGTFAMYYSTPKAPSKSDIDYIENQAKIAGIVFEQMQARKQLAVHNEKLEEQVLQRTNALQESLQELQDIQAQLIESEKNSALGILVAAVAHEVNTPLGIALTGSTTMLEKIKNIDEALTNITLTQSMLSEFIQAATDMTELTVNNLRRAADIVGNFKKVAVDQGMDDFREVNLDQYLHEVVSTLKTKFRNTGYRVEIECPDDIMFKTYPGALFQVLTNLVMNSLIHGFDGLKSGLMTIRAEIKEQHLYLYYSDNGRGIEEHVRERIFEPFVTTRRNTGGSGLGMHIVYELVTERLEGDISCAHKMEGGVHFTLTLPILPGT